MARIKELHQALLQAFPTRAALTQMVRFGLEENLEAIAGGGDLSATTLQLLEWAVAHDKLDALVQAALEANPGNRALRAAAAPPVAGPAPGAPPSKGPALVELLATLYSRKADAERLCDTASIVRQRVDFDGSILNVWHRVLTEADNSGRAQALLDIVCGEYPARRADILRARNG